tara:strand:- start:978 stop:1634 length:657 start_codon:yes stop_codon:yes gene_type:complete
MQRPESSEQELFTNGTFEHEYSNEEDIVLEEFTSSNCNTNTDEDIVIEKFGEEDEKDENNEKDDIKKAKEKEASSFNDMASTIYDAIVDNTMRIREYVRETSYFGGILKPITSAINVEDEIIARIFIGAAIIGALKKMSYLDSFGYISFPQIIISIIRVLVAAFYPFVYLSIIFCEELFWENIKPNKTIPQLQYSNPVPQQPPRYPYFQDSQLSQPLR